VSTRPKIASVAGAAVICLVAGVSSTAARKASLSDECAHALTRRQQRQPQRLTTMAPVALTSLVGVLRKPAAPTDRLPAGGLYAIEPSEYRAVWPRATRLLGTGADRTRYYVVIGIRSPQSFPLVCVKGAQPRRTRSAKPEPPLGAVATVAQFRSFPGGEDTAAIPFTASAISAGRATSIEPAGPVAALAPYVALVPDGVSSVTVTVGANQPTGVPVTANLAVAEIPNPREGDIVTERWYSPDGTLTKTVSETRKVATSAPGRVIGETIG
jgi:hypothetical protein